MSELLPSTDGFMTYSGSTTRPGCHEGVEWFVMNRPVYLGELEMAALRSLKQGEQTQPKSPLGKPNARPLQDKNGRLVRTNVKVAPKEIQQDDDSKKKRRKRCPDITEEGGMTYTANAGWEEED